MVISLMGRGLVDDKLGDGRLEDGTPADDIPGGGTYGRDRCVEDRYDLDPCSLLRRTQGCNWAKGFLAAGPAAGEAMAAALVVRAAAPAEATGSAVEVLWEAGWG